jgi:hypothetical protein
LAENSNHRQHGNRALSEIQVIDGIMEIALWLETLITDGMEITLWLKTQTIDSMEIALCLKPKK